MKMRSCICAAAVAAAFGVAQARADVIAKWDFGTTGVQAAPYNNPAPTTGAGTATTLGMDNNYNGGNSTSDDITAVKGTANKLFTENLWRIRGAQTTATPSGNNGWATHASGAAQYTQGVELDASTAGFQNIGFAFDWNSSAQGIRDLQFQYNTNIANPAGWTNFGGTSPTGTFIAVPNDYYNAPNSPTINVDLSPVAGANNDPNFGVRLVSAYDSTGNVPNDYAGATLSTGGQTTIYNNTSGNWRFGNLTFSGTAIPTPEPTSLGLALIGLAASLRRRTR